MSVWWLICTTIGTHGAWSPTAAIPAPPGRWMATVPRMHSWRAMRPWRRALPLPGMEAHDGSHTLAPRRGGKLPRGWERPGAATDASGREAGGAHGRLAGAA